MTDPGTPWTKFGFPISSEKIAKNKVGASPTVLGKLESPVQFQLNVWSKDAFSPVDQILTSRFIGFSSKKIVKYNVAPLPSPVGRRIRYFSMGNSWSILQLDRFMPYYESFDMLSFDKYDTNVFKKVWCLLCKLATIISSQTFLGKVPEHFREYCMKSLPWAFYSKKRTYLCIVSWSRAFFSFSMATASIRVW